MAYIGVQPADAYTSFAVQHFTTSATTSYTLNHSVANENEIALFINNVRQEPGSSYAYTASGTSLTLSAATSASDTMYCVFIGKAVQTVTPTLPIANFSSTGIDDNADATAITIDSSENVLVGKTSVAYQTVGHELKADGRAFHTSSGGKALSLTRTTSNGAIMDFYNSGGTEVGSIETSSSGIGIKLGGTASGNLLDDYEEGTWTPSFEFAAAQPTAGNTTGTGFYTKVGNMVTVWGTCENVNVTGGSGDVRIRDLPFTSKASVNLNGWHGAISVSQMTFAGYVNCDVQDGLSYIRPLENISGSSRDILNLSNCTHGATNVYFCVNYQVN